MASQEVRGTEVPQWGSGTKPRCGVWGTRPPEAEDFCTFVHNIIKNGYTKCVFRYIDIDIVRNLKKTRSSAVTKRPRDASCQSLVSLQYVDRKFCFRFNTAYTVLFSLRHSRACCTLR